MRTRVAWQGGRSGERPPPFAAPQRGSPAPAVGPLRAALLRRTSTEDQQDPTISIPRQPHACQAALPSDAVIVTHFYGIESGKDLHARGRGRGHERFGIPVRRDGGIQDLLDRVDRADGADRGFDAVICESVDPIARRTYFGGLIEHRLERADVALLAADDRDDAVCGAAGGAISDPPARISSCPFSGSG